MSLDADCVKIVFIVGGSYPYEMFTFFYNFYRNHGPYNERFGPYVEIYVGQRIKISLTLLKGPCPY